ncbi:BUD32 family EKC/KEOPS complex subunit [Anaeromicropila populeti]|uniref:Protein kinase domain-containing protein n=1 Tax=Anaeromicropila populeti TaxID=37658 RepID=A0A1I6HT43_9FIRM|nr:hypothetical protein [Anaeromicropila populeti]SFR57609.1 hypothetical protein SAMN05661086_00265 [Anaeromicropila populeti]
MSKDNCFIKKFISKKNHVSLHKYTDEGGKQYVVKRFHNADSYQAELEMYRCLIHCQQNEAGSQLNYPNLLDYDDSKLSLCLEYIKGNNVLELLEYYESRSFVKEAAKVLIQVLQWLEQFYSTIGIDGDEVLGDVNLRNFIYAENKIFGIDFEDARSGCRHIEMLEVLARYLLYNPAKSEFKHTVLSIVEKQYLAVSMKNQGIEKYADLLENEITHIQMRRKRFT